MYQLIQKLLSIAKIILSPKGGLLYILSKARSVASFEINNSLFRLNSHIKTIIDVGANIGQYASASHQFYPNAIIYSFEPVPETFEKLKANTAKTENIKVYSCALGDTEGSIDFFQNEHSHASSVLEVSTEQKEAIPSTSNYKKIEVPVHKLDDFEFPSPLLRPILLKLDVQGYEKQVLLGGENFVKNVDYLLLEMSFIRMYNDEPLFDEMHDYIKSIGYSLVGPIGSLPSDNGQIMQMDMLYKRNDYNED